MTVVRLELIIIFAFLRHWSPSFYLLLSINRCCAMYTVQMDFVNRNSELFYLTTTTNHNNNHHLRASVTMNWYQRYYGSKCIRRLNVLWGAMDDLEKKLITILLSMTLYRRWEFWILRELTPKNMIVKFKWWPLYFFHWSHWFSIPIHNENYQVLNT